MVKTEKKGHNSKKKDIRLEILGILIMAFALLIFLGLISYHPSDYPNTGARTAVRNWLGLAGSLIAYGLYTYTIGYACLILPLLLFLLGWNIFLLRPFRPFLRISFYLLALGIIVSTLLALPEAVSGESRFGFRLSGVLGGFFADHLNRYAGTVGSTIILLTSMIILIVAATSWSMRDAILGFRDGIQRMVQSITRRRKIRPPQAQRVGWEEDPGEEEEEEREKRRKSQPVRPERARVVEPAPKRPPIEFSASPAREPEPVKGKSPAAASGVQAAGFRAGGVQQPGVRTEGAQASGVYTMPSLDLLNPPPPPVESLSRAALEEQGRFLEEKLKEFDVQGTVIGCQTGPVITRFEIRPAPGVKISRFVGCQDDLALAMKAPRVRVVAPIPGKAAVGVEIPNPQPGLVSMREILESRAFQRTSSRLTIALGKTIDGHPYVADLADMPHLLVAGATNSGKSVCLNTIITSLLYRSLPSDVKLVLVDPKKLELSLYADLKNHHLTGREDLNEDVITTASNAIAVLRSLEGEMDRRYHMLARAGVRFIDDYNRAVEAGHVRQDGAEAPKKLPYLVLIMDELADLMITGAREVEEPIQKLAQMSRAVGIHLILATQRPSVDVITGVIKANFPSRIAFQVFAKIDSRTILDRNGAEKLLGKGDMLFLNPREPEPIRLHGAYISTEEVKRVVAHIRRQPSGESFRLPAYSSRESGEGMQNGERDELFRQAAELVVRHQQGSASLLQRRLRVGYARAGRLIDELEDAGVLAPSEGAKPRDVLMDEKQLSEFFKALAEAEQDQEETG